MQAIGAETMGSSPIERNFNYQNYRTIYALIYFKHVNKSRYQMLMYVHVAIIPVNDENKFLGEEIIKQSKKNVAKCTSSYFDREKFIEESDREMEGMTDIEELA